MLGFCGLAEEGAKGKDDACRDKESFERGGVEGEDCEEERDECEKCYRVDVDVVEDEIFLGLPVGVEVVDHGEGRLGEAEIARSWRRWGFDILLRQGGLPSV